MKRACKNCKYFVKHPLFINDHDVGGECRRRSSQVRSCDPCAFPTVFADMYCGDFEQNNLEEKE